MRPEAGTSGTAFGFSAAVAGAEVAGAAGCPRSVGVAGFGGSGATRISGIGNTPDALRLSPPARDALDSGTGVTADAEGLRVTDIWPAGGGSGAGSSVSVTGLAAGGLAGVTSASGSDATAAVDTSDGGRSGWSAIPAFGAAAGVVGARVKPCARAAADAAAGCTAVGVGDEEHVTTSAATAAHTTRNSTGFRNIV
ncbi:MAG TPA: hypothetical protein VMW87_16845 [Spirochaetia bacterium]|nr:hypothetical protein [Spirochaetia bacterium]